MVEALKQSFMDCQLSCTSPLPRVWVIETLARSNQIDISLLLDLLEKTPEVSDDRGRNAREFVSLRILESFFDQGARTNLVSSALSQKISLDLSDDSCEDVLRRILTETPPSHLKTPGPEMSKWDLQPFIEHKRSSLAGNALQQLKNAMLTGSHSFLASLKERSGLPDANPPEHVTAADDGNCNGITPRHEGSDTNDYDLSQRDLPDENLEAVNRKRRATSGNAGDTSSENLILSKNGCEAHINPVKKYKHGIICSEHNVVENSTSSTVDALFIDRSTECSLVRTHLEKMGLNGPSNDDRCTSSKGLVGPDEVLSCEKQVPCCDTEVNNRSEAGKGQDHCIEEAKSDKDGFCNLTKTEDVNKKLEQNTRRNILNVGEVEEIDISSNTGENNDDRTDISAEEKSQGLEDENVEGDEDGLHVVGTSDEDMDKLHQNVLRNVPNVGEAEEDVNKSNDSDGYQDERTNIDTKKKVFLNSQCTYSQDSVATTDWREFNLCVKCNLGGKLLVCSSDSCPLVIHQSCLGSDEIFDSTGEFHCPFCAYSQAISRYMEIKKKAAMARKDLSTLICLGTEKGSKKQLHGLCKRNQNDLELDDGFPKSNELNTRDTKKVSNRQRKKKLEYEQAGPSECSPPKAHGHHQMAVRAIRKSQGEITSCQVLGRSGGSDMHANTRPKKGILCPPETDLPRENKSLRSPDSAYAEDSSEEGNENSGASKYFIRFRKQERLHSYPAIPQLRRKRLPWTSEEEDKLKEGVRVYCSPHDKIIPWKTILEHGAGIFHQSRSTMDLKDKWRNMCKAAQSTNELI